MKIKVTKKISIKSDKPIEILIKTPFIKLDQLLKFAGIAQSGGHAKEIVAEGVVFVNGEISMQRGKKIKENDIVSVDDIKIIVKQEIIQ